MLRGGGPLQGDVDFLEAKWKSLRLAALSREEQTALLLHGFFESS